MSSSGLKGQMGRISYSFFSLFLPEFESNFKLILKWEIPRVYVLPPSTAGKFMLTSLQIAPVYEKHLDSKYALNPLPHVGTCWKLTEANQLH